MGGGPMLQANFEIVKILKSRLFLVNLQHEFRGSIDRYRKSDKTVKRYGTWLPYSGDRSSIIAAIDLCAIIEYVENRENRSGIELPTRWWWSGKSYGDHVGRALIELEQTFHLPQARIFTTYGSRPHQSPIRPISPKHENDQAYPEVKERSLVWTPPKSRLFLCNFRYDYLEFWNSDLDAIWQDDRHCNSL